MLTVNWVQSKKQPNKQNQKAFAEKYFKNKVSKTTRKYTGRIQTQAGSTRREGLLRSGRGERADTAHLHA